MELYKGSMDLQEHLDAFKSMMTLAVASNPIKCMALKITLKKQLSSGLTLRLRSINKFSNLSSRFLSYFTTQRFKTKSVSSLLGIFQCQGELLRDYLESFNAETLLVEDLNTQVAVLTLLNGLCPESFKDLLSKRPAKIMDEIQMRVKKYIYLEEIQKATVNRGKNQGASKSSS